MCMCCVVLCMHECVYEMSCCITYNNGHIHVQGLLRLHGKTTKSYLQKKFYYLTSWDWGGVHKKADVMTQAKKALRKLTYIKTQLYCKYAVVQCSLLNNSYMYIHSWSWFKIWLIPHIKTSHISVRDWRSLMLVWGLGWMEATSSNSREEAAWC